jgi:hypothetical protein
MDLDTQLRLANTIANYLGAFCLLTLVFMGHEIVKRLRNIDVNAHMLKILKKTERKN